MKILLIYLMLFALVLPQGVLAQTALSANANAAVQINQARQANAVLMRQCTWNSRTEIIYQGQVKDTRIELINYAPDGRLQRILLNDQSAPMPRGFLRRHVAEDEKKKMEEYLQGLQGLLEQYTLPATGKILDFMMSATITVPMSADCL